MLTRSGMSGLETATAMAFGLEGAPPSPRGALPPAAALEDTLLAALRRPPCVVSFSGGRDSSLVRAAAAAAADRVGLPPPLPVSLRFPEAPPSDESRWQERVIAHLGLHDWIRIGLSTELDFIGRVAAPLLLRHGLLFPPNAHLVAPMLEHAAGGSLVSGLGGDELFGLWQRRRLADLAARRARPTLGDAARLAGALAPPRVRRAALRRRCAAQPLPWLRDRAQAELNARLLEQDVYANCRWDRHALAVPRARSIRLAVRDIGRIAAERDVAYHAPLADPGFAASLARAGGWRGFGGRSATMEACFGDALPAEVLARRQKAIFNDVFFTEDVRRFARSWSGRGLDESLVDPDALRRTWLAPLVDYRSALLLQSAWLHDHGAEHG